MSLLRFQEAGRVEAYTSCVGEKGVVCLLLFRFIPVLLLLHVNGEPLEK
jgi:hypothetical protein